MSDQPAASDDSSIEWKKATSQNGASFSVGREKTESVTEDKTEVAAMSLKGFGIVVNWPVGDSSWKDTTDEVKEVAGITRYRLWAPESFPSIYEFGFTNTINYNFSFTDETGDSYGVNTWTTGDHSVKYNSEKPTIVFISGT
ncbi:hypothetical protein B9Z19DRAFT_1126820 [Tuber borchii]|uniref:Uncharacterized protein n=1 Tax=Tuber borchii TaxID=42251 RepID=A0A2T6ZSF4_TUBBO|nr:hypothetical protein B9Z19DRAFT_1126820 [Tuber borchii]